MANGRNWRKTHSGLVIVLKGNILGKKIKCEVFLSLTNIQLVASVLTNDHK